MAILELEKKIVLEQGSIGHKCRECNEPAVKQTSRGAWLCESPICFSLYDDDEVPEPGAYNPAA